jgi:hypothetical protein
MKGKSINLALISYEIWALLQKSSFPQTFETSLSSFETKHLFATKPINIKGSVLNANIFSGTELAFLTARKQQGRFVQLRLN